MIYFVFISSVILAHQYEKKEHRIYIISLVSLLSIFIGLRSKYIGSDTISYHVLFTYLRNGVTSDNYEKGFQYISMFLLKVFNRPEYLILFYSVLTQTLIILRLATLKKECSFTLMVLVYLISFYSQSGNIMRQYIALALIFFGTHLLERRHFVWFGIIVIIAMQFHTTAFLGLLFIPLYIFYNEEKSRVSLILMTPFVLIIGIYVYYTIVAQNYSYYFDIHNNSLGFMNFLKLLLILIAVFLNKSNNIENDDINIYNKNSMKYITSIYVIGVLLSFLGYIVTTFLRISLYFSIFEVPFISKIISKGNGHQIMLMLYSILLTYLLYQNIIVGWAGFSEYSTWLFTK